MFAQDICDRQDKDLSNTIDINRKDRAKRYHHSSFAIRHSSIPACPGWVLQETKLNELAPDNREEKEAGKKIPAFILPEGYNGKILLVSISGDGIEKTVILRSGDLWHREILRNTEAEIQKLGIRNARVYELGGAHLRFEPDGTILIHGNSRQYGACDKEYAATLVKDAVPGRRVDVQT